MYANYTNADGEEVFPSDEAVEAAITAGALDMSSGARRFVCPMIKLQPLRVVAAGGSRTAVGHAPADGLAAHRASEPGLGQRVAVDLPRTPHRRQGRAFDQALTGASLRGGVTRPRAHATRRSVAGSRSSHSSRAATLARAEGWKLQPDCREVHGVGRLVHVDAFAGLDLRGVMRTPRREAARGSSLTVEDRTSAGS